MKANRGPQVESAYEEDQMVDLQASLQHAIQDKTVIRAIQKVLRKEFRGAYVSAMRQSGRAFLVVEYQGQEYEFEVGA
jgi:hypothetical protein